MNALPLLLVLLAQEPGGAAPLLEKGERLFRQGDTAGALAAFQAAAKADPSDARPLYLRGVALEKKGDAPGATAAYRKAIGSRATSPRRTTTWARCCSRAATRGRRRELEAAVKAQPDYAEAQYNLGVARDAVGKKAEAVAAYREAARLSRPTPGTGEPGCGAAPHWRPSAARSRAEGGARAWRRATRSPGPTWAWSSRTRRTRRRPAALDKATKLKPDSALAWNRLGRVELRRGSCCPRPRPRRSGRASSSQERRLRGRSLPRAVRAEGHRARRRRMPRRRRARPQEPARALRARQGAGRQGRLPRRASRAGPLQGAPGRQARGAEAGRRHRATCTKRGAR